MSTQRPGYVHGDADVPPLGQEEVGGTNNSDHQHHHPKIGALFPKDFHAKGAGINEKGVDDGSSGRDLPAYEGEEAERAIVNTAEDLVTRVIDVEDDPTLNPWTFRAFFLGTMKMWVFHIKDCFAYMTV